jgi:hypothetical protein
MVQDDPKLPDGGGEIPKSQGRGWRFDPPVVKSPLHLTENLLGGSTASCASALACRPFVLKKKEKEIGKRGTSVWVGLPIFASSYPIKERPT